MWDSRDTARSALHKKGLACAGGIGAQQSKDRHQQSSGRERQDTLPIAAHRARLD